MENKQASMSDSLVSIGVPVYNDAPWLRNSLDHLLAQDYRNLEIILADDGSTDGSREICREYAHRDSRIRLFENKHNLGAMDNHEFVFDVSTGDFFAWGSGHDYFEPAFVSRTLEMLRSNPSMVMCCSRAVTEDASGKILSTSTGGLDTRGLPAVGRFRHLLDHRRAGGTMNILYGLYRAEILAWTKTLFIDSAGADSIWLGELSLTGEMTQIDEILFHRVEAWSRPVGKDASHEWFKRLGLSQGREKKLIPFLNMLYEYLRMIDNSEVSTLEKESLCEDVNKIAIDRETAIQKEIKRFIDYSKEELLALESQPVFRRYRASQILTTLEHALQFGFDCAGLNQVRAMCLTEMGLKAEARAIVRDETRARFKKYTSKALGYYGYKLVNRLRRLFK